MTDRELLELAAKAAGMVGYVHSAINGQEYMAFDEGGSQSDYWSPLTDDGAALRLAVKLKIIITFADGGSGPYVCAGQRLGPFSRERLPVKIFALEEELAATCRAIVRAAAEIGRGME